MTIVPEMRDDEIETAWFQRIAPGIRRTMEARAKHYASIPDFAKATNTFEQTWLDVMDSATKRWQRERLRRIARRVYRESRWYLRPWQLLIDCMLFGLARQKGMIS